MTTISPWINFNGNAEEAFNFYKSVLGGEFTKVLRFKDLAGSGIPEGGEDAEKIMQIILPVGRGMLIGNDVPSFLGKVSESENRSKIHVAPESKEDAERIFAGLTVGAEVEAPLGNSPWGTTFGMFRDKYGIEWTIECTPNT